MKKFKFLTLFLLSFWIKSSFAQIDLAIGNISAGYTQYNQNSGIVSGVYFDALNNGNSAAGAFRIALFLVDPNNFNNLYEVHSKNVGGQGGNSLLTYTNINIDFNNTSGIPAGNYRLLVSIDEDNVIPETDEFNNALYISTQGNNLYYNPLAVGIDETNSSLSSFNNYPNPAVTSTTINYQFETQPITASIRIYNLTGSLIQEIEIDDQQNNIEFSVAELNSGVYFYSLILDGKALKTNKLIVSH
jgi:hemolysin activation/secretion protein